MAKSSSKSLSKPYPLSLRLAASDVALIDRAARMRGRSRTEFMREAAVLEAEFAMSSVGSLRVSPEAYAAFMGAISTAPQAVSEIAGVVKRKAPWEQT